MDEIESLKKAEVIAVDRVHVFIICPHCGMIHLHGSTRNNTLDEYGSRVPHCIPKDVVDGDTLSLVQYDLITTPDTIRSDDELTTKKLKLNERQLRMRQSIFQRIADERKRISDDKILNAVRELALRGSKPDFWRIKIYSGEPHGKVKDWLHEHGIWYSSYDRKGWYIEHPDKATSELITIFSVKE